VKGRPAETGGAVAAIAVLVAHTLGVDNAQVITALVAAVGLVPAAITLLVSNGGLRGVAAKIWRGKPPAA
jgi:hypothetical protein